MTKATLPRFSDFTISVVAVFIAVTLESPSAQQREHFLDLLRVPRTAGFLTPPEAGDIPPDRRLGPGGVGVLSHGPGPISPFTLRATLLSLDKLSYRSREPFVYEVELKNTGTAPVSFPWSPDPSLVDHSLRDATFVMVGLGDADDPRSFAELGHVFLYGSSSVPGTLETILPDETVRIRVGSEWMDDSQRMERLQVVVKPTLGALSYDYIKSANTITVQAQGR